ncbi:MAG: hypothetical protein AAGJ81_12695 [Verrucomicrobiota bacterium]
MGFYDPQYAIIDLSEEDIPAVLKKNGLIELYNNSNHPDFSGRLARVLVHESIHHWQFTSSPYLRQKLLEPKQDSNQSSNKSARFSSHAITECFARFWDVMIRSPDTIIQEEEIDTEGVQISVLRPGMLRTCTQAAFELCMLKGPGCRSHGPPYEWMKHECSDSYMPDLLLPLAAHIALCSTNPSDAFYEAVRAFNNNQSIRLWLEKCDPNPKNQWPRTNFINVDWLRVFPLAVKALKDNKKLMKLCPRSLDPFADFSKESVKSHPIWSKVPFGFSKQNCYESVINALDTRAPAGLELHWAEQLIAKSHPNAAFIFPGIVNFRYCLGKFAGPAAVRFRDQIVFSDWVDSELQDVILKSVLETT